MKILRKLWRKLWAIIQLEILYAPKRIRVWLMGGKFAAAVRDSDGELLWRVGDQKLYRESEKYMNKM